MLDIESVYPSLLITYLSLIVAILGARIQLAAGKSVTTWLQSLMRDNYDEGLAICCLLNHKLILNQNSYN